MAAHLPQPPAPNPHPKKKMKGNGTRLPSGLNARQESFIRELIKNGGNVTHAHMAAYQSSNPNVAAVGGQHLLRNIRVRAAFEDACAKLNFGAGSIADVIVAATKAKKDDEADWKIRVGAVSLAARLLDLEPKDEKSDQKAAKHLHLHGLSRSEMLFLARTGRLPSADEISPCGSGTTTCSGVLEGADDNRPQDDK